MNTARYFSGLQKAAGDHAQARKSPGRLSETYTHPLSGKGCTSSCAPVTSAKQQNAATARAFSYCRQPTSILAGRLHHDQQLPKQEQPGAVQRFHHESSRSPSMRGGVVPQPHHCRRHATPPCQSSKHQPSAAWRSTSTSLHGTSILRRRLACQSAPSQVLKQAISEAIRPGRAKVTAEHAPEPLCEANAPDEAHQASPTTGRRSSFWLRLLLQVADDFPNARRGGAMLR
jgi:hypothetical protein